MKNRLSWAQSACARILRPLVRLALGMGLKHPHLEELLRDLLVDEARSLWRAKGVVKPNISQIAVTTGLNRKEVTLRVRNAADPLPHTELSAAAKTFTLWLQRANEDPLYRRLTTANQTEGPSFESIARQASRGDVHHRAVLDELVRLGMVSEHEGWAELLADGFVPTQDLQATLAFLGDNTRDHLLAAVSNTLDAAPPFLERAVFADGLSQQDCENIHLNVRKRWDTLHHDLVGQLTEAVDRHGGSGTSRMRIGIYVYHEEADPSTAPRPGEEGSTP
ncbi:MAG: hypothetical protein KF740_09510 [Ramlibacter sp.]|nr:hypothetical protein [Ramlibacter sp.]